MRAHYPSTVLIPLIATSLSAYAAVTQRFRIDLDGDGRQEVVQITSSKGTQEWRSRATVSVGNARYSTEYFSAEGDTPDIRPVHIDRKKKSRQLVLNSPEAGTCVFYVLAYRASKLHLLLRHDSGPSCKSPEELGDGQVRVSKWQGFWNREEIYRLSEDGLSLALVPTEIYQVGAAGAAGLGLTLEGAECPVKSVSEGTFVQVKSFDAARDRYYVQTLSGSCGWLPAQDLSTLSKKFKSLPWAN